MISRILALFPAGIVLLFTGTLHAQLINVDFNNDSFGSAHGGPATGPNMTGAAVFGTTGDQWNGISVNSGSGVSLIYSDGSASPVTMTFTSGGGYDANSFAGSTPFAGTPYDALMEDYLFTSGSAQTITLSGLATNATYKLILYSAGDAAAAGRTTSFTVNNRTQNSVWDAVSGALVAGVNYVEFFGAAPDASGNLTIGYTGNSAAEGDVNGFQIQPDSGPAGAAPATSSAYAWSTMAGLPISGSTDGVGSAAQFSGPADVAVDAGGNIYVADFHNFTIRKVTPGGTSTTIAGFAGISGSADGVGSAARFSFPASVAVDAATNVYVGDTGNYTIRKLTPVGTNWVVTTIVGLVGSAGNADGTNSNARVYEPDGIAVDAAGNLYVTDGEDQSVRKVTPVGTNWVMTIIAGSPTGDFGSADGTGTNASFSAPAGITVDSATNLYVADLGNNTIRQITPVGTNWVVTTIAGLAGTQGTNDGTGGSVRFFGPYGIAIDGTGTLYVTDNENNTLRKLILSGGSWISSTLAGYTVFDRFGNSTHGSSVDGTGSNARFNFPYGIALDNSHNIIVADSGNNEIRKCTSGGVVSTLAGVAGYAGNADGVGNAARFNSPDGIALDTMGNVYIADQANQTIRRITPDGEVTTLAGQPGIQGTNDGVGSNARFYNPAGIAVNASGNIYVADYFNNTIRLVTAAGTVSTLAGQPQFDGSGNPIGANVDGVGSAARFNGPQGIALDTNGVVYVADSENGTIRRITSRTRFVPPGVFVTTWTVTTIAGSAGHNATVDGINTGAQFASPSGIAIDGSGNIYVVGGDRAVRKITLVGTNWVVSTIAMVPQGGSSPDNGVSVDGSGNVYVVNWLHNSILKLTPVGANWLTTIIGGSNLGFIRGSEDGSGSDAEFDNPTDLVSDIAGNVFVADTGNNTIRKGVFTAFAAANPVPVVQPTANAQLTVVLLPPEAGGQWRFPWEAAWRNSGDTASGLVASNYPVQFRNIPGYLTIPTNFNVAVPAGASVSITNQYYPTVAPDALGTGTLTVNIEPNSPPNDGWRFLGETSWRAAGSTVTNLLPDFYFIEFEPVAGYSKPANLAVQVSAGLPAVASGNYLLATPAPANALLPVPVPSAEIPDVAHYPFGFDGQLQTDVGFGSGTAVQTNIVLTAAHLVFDDETLGYVSQAYWYNQKETGVFNPAPLAARGWYVLSGYASERTNDLQSGLYVPDQSSPQSRNMDVAALYFLTPVAGGGYSGYLPSDGSPNLWLTGTAEKMLAGYPVDASAFGLTNIVPGQLYQVGPQPYALAPASDPVADPEIYVGNWFLSYPGNSGGPFYVQYNGYYYPAGVYLGTLYNGTVPYASAIRAIDSNVVNVITLASALGDSGTNFSGGGVITIIPSRNISSAHPGYLLLQLGPPSAVQSGAAWKLASQSDNYYSVANPSLQEITTTNALTVQFKTIPGWILPTNRSVTVVSGNILTNFASYTVTNPVLTVDVAHGLQINGTTNTTYQIQSNRTPVGGTWISFQTNTVGASGSAVVTNRPRPGFYRALWLTNSP